MLDGASSEDVAPIMKSALMAEPPKKKSLSPDISNKNKETVERFLLKRNERSRNHMKEISRWRYTNNYCNLHDLRSIQEEYGASGYMEDFKLGKKPFLTPRRDRQLKVLKDAVNAAEGSSRRKDGL